LKLSPIARAVEPAPPDETESPALLAGALDSLRVAITIFDEQLNLLYANQHFDYLFRSMPPRQSLTGKSYDDLVRLEVASGEIARPSLRAGIEAYVVHRRDQFRKGQFRPLDIHLADGRIVEIKARQTPSGGWIALWSDVTEARHVLMRFEDVTELSTDAVAFYSHDDKLIACNEGYARMVGVAGPEQLKGLSFTDVLRRAVQSGRFAIDPDLDFVAQRVGLRRLQAAAYTLETKTGEAYLVRDRATRDGGRAVVFTDVTDSKRTQYALDEQIAALKRTEQALTNLRAESVRQASYLEDVTRKLGAVEAEAGTAKTALMRTMSHELKTPLNAIIGFADLLRVSGAALPAEQIVEYAGLIHAGGHTLLRLLNQILDLTRIAGGRYTLHRERLEAQRIVRDVQERFAERAHGKSIVFNETPGDAQVTVDADEGALRAILGQLTDNAVNFTPQGGQVTFTVERNGPHVRFVVSDNGPGVADDDIARILEPFEQVGRGTTDHKGGAGLGLTLAKALAELHGGSLTVASVPGAGFTATLELAGA
jgi:two-component system cell cycle sensor histidine kinase PleC